MSPEECVGLIKQVSSLDELREKWSEVGTRRDISFFNWLIEKGLIEAYPAFIENLLQDPNINLMPYREKLKVQIKKTNYLKTDGIEDLVCDYLTGEKSNREKLKAYIKATHCFKVDSIEDLVCDYLIEDKPRP